MPGHRISCTNSLALPTNTTRQVDPPTINNRLEDPSQELLDNDSPLSTLHNSPHVSRLNPPIPDTFPRQRIILSINRLELFRQVDNHITRECVTANMACQRDPRCAKRIDKFESIEQETRRTITTSRQPSSAPNVRVELRTQQGPEYTTASVPRIMPADQNCRTPVGHSSQFDCRSRMIVFQFRNPYRIRPNFRFLDISMPLPTPLTLR